MRLRWVCSERWPIRAAPRVNIISGSCTQRAAAIWATAPATAIVALSFELVRQMATPDFDLELNLHRAMLGSAHKECLWKPESKVVRRFSLTVDAVSWKATSGEDTVPSE